MKKLFPILFLLLSFSLFVSAQNVKTVSDAKDDDRSAFEDAQKSERKIVGKVVKVSDGDTVTVLDADNQQYKIRFEGIDAPESKQDFGQKAKQHLSDLVFGKQVTVITSKVDKYKRYVGKVMLGTTDINLEQIKGGFAWHYKKYADEQVMPDRTVYAEEEIKARNAKLGLWADAKPTPPWDWRQGVNNANLADVPPGSIIGNKNSMVYHIPGCSTYAKVGADNRVIFKTREEAEKAGFKMAKNCATSGRSEESVLDTPQTLPAANPNPLPAPLPATTTSTKKDEKKTDRTYIKGSRGGCYYINSNGNKTYVDKALCN
jgi:endonuclease YncB( thermonuclease family)